jgi:hypothetical protein
VFCEQCGNQLPEASRFCNACGTAVVGVVTSHPVVQGQGSTAQAVQMAAARSDIAPLESQGPMRISNLTPPPEPKQYPAVQWLFGTAAVALVILVAIVLANTPHKVSGKDDSLRQITTMPVIRTYDVGLPESSFTIAAGQYIYCKFTVPQRARNVHIDGHFDATGGSGNDVEVLLVNQEGLTNWTNHHQAIAYYSSGRLTTDSLNVQLPATTDAATTYYLVFNNAFSLFSNKAVSSDIKLHYDRAL